LQLLEYVVLLKFEIENHEHLHQGDARSEDEEAPGSDIGESFNNDDWLVAKEVGQ
jgi:hypothetical protein